MKRRYLALLLIVSACGLLSGSAWALDPKACDPKAQDGGGACFGTELTFTNEDIQANDDGIKKEYQKKYYTLWRDKLKGVCSETQVKKNAVSCRLEKMVQKQDPKTKCTLDNRSNGNEEIADQTAFRVCIYSNDWTQAWHYEVGVDGGCIELSSKPMNYRWLQVMSDGGAGSILNKYLFDVAYSLHAASDAKDTLKARKERGGGGGHVHIDAESAFGNNPIKMLNFMTDIHNLRMFPLGPDMGTLTLNCPPLSMLWPGQRAAYRNILADYAKNKDVLKREFESLRTLGMSKIVPDVYYATYIDRVLDPNNSADAAILKRRAGEMGHNVDRMTAAEMQQALKKAFGSNRLSDYENENGEGWAHKAHDIRMDLAPDRYGTIELRNIAAEGTTDELLAILGLLHDRAAMTKADTVTDLLNDKDLKLSQPDDDSMKSWKLGAKYYQTHGLTPLEADDIAKRFVSYVKEANEKEAKWRLNNLLAFMPEGIRAKVMASIK